MSDYLDPENEELLQDFFIEAETQVETMERTVLAIENNPSDRDLVDELFRAVHTLKGEACSAQRDELVRFTHRLGQRLNQLRTSRAELNPATLDLLGQAIDAVRAMFEGTASSLEIARLDEAMLAAAESLDLGETAEPQEDLLATRDPAIGSGPPETPNAGATPALHDQLAQLSDEMLSAHSAVRRELDMMIKEFLYSAPDIGNALQSRAASIPALLEPLESRLQAIISGSFGLPAAPGEPES